MGESEKLKKVRRLVVEVLEKLGVDAKVEVTETEDGLRVEVCGQDLGALIGYHGETLSSLQLFLNLLFYRRLGKWQRVLVDVGGYRADRERKLYELAHRMADRARFLQTPVELFPMSAADRRLIHLALANEEGITTESVGEGWERRVVVKPTGS